MPSPTPSRTLHIADLFCGAGGTSTGALQACEALGYRAQLTAINHWTTAIATHETNHPEARHLCQSLDTINPRDLYPLGQLDLLWGSPECMSHSIARGGRPVNDQSRATAWCITRWAEALQPGVILVENVPEFLDWGPIGTNGKPLKSQKGAIFRSWVSTLEAIGYRVDHRLLCAADYGDPTSRKRLFIQAVRGRRKIRWPEPTHFPVDRTGGDDLFGAQPWRGAREIINWEHPTQSIFTRSRPLSPNTLRRIEIGLQRYGLKPFMVPQQQWHQTRSLDKPLPAITSRGAEGLCQPFLVQANFGQRHDSRVSSIEDPLKTVLGSNVHGLCQPYLVTVSHQGGDGSRVHSVDDPLNTVTNRNNVGLCQPFIQRVGHYGRESNGLSDLDDPLTTVTTKQEHALVEPYLVTLRGTKAHQIDGSSQPLDTPLPALTAGGGHVGLCQPFLTKFYGTATAQSIDDPLDTVTTKERHALVLPRVVVDGEEYGLDIHFRMLQPDELAAAQGFPADYQFVGNKSQVTKQIGNAVPCGLARALVNAVLQPRH